MKSASSARVSVRAPPYIDATVNAKSSSATLSQGRVKRSDVTPLMMTVMGSPTKETSSALERMGWSGSAWQEAII
jgi:hypothetical protein